MTPEAWVTLALAVVLPLWASALWVVWQVRRIRQTLYGDNGASMVHVVDRLRADSHWANNCLLVLSVHAEVEIPERPKA